MIWFHESIEGIKALVSLFLGMAIIMIGLELTRRFITRGRVNK